MNESRHLAMFGLGSPRVTAGQMRAVFVARRSQMRKKRVPPSQSQNVAEDSAGKLRKSQPRLLPHSRGIHLAER
jgi:hypothetical protein